MLRNDYIFTDPGSIWERIILRIHQRHLGHLKNTYIGTIRYQCLKVPMFDEQTSAYYKNNKMTSMQQCSRHIHSSARADIWWALPMNMYDYTLPFNFYHFLYISKLFCEALGLLFNDQTQARSASIKEQAWNIYNTCFEWLRVMSLLTLMIEIY